MTENTEYNTVEFNDISGRPKGIDDGIYEPVPNPWDDAPENVYFYEKIYEDGHLGAFTKSAEFAYKLGWDIENNYIPISDTQQSDINGWTYRKEVCPMKTDEDKFNEAKQNKLSELKKTADSALNGAYVVSSLGFKADANPAAVRDLEGLVIIGADSVMFCDYENNFHPLNKEQVLTLQKEILLNGQNLYAQKWNYRAAVNAAETLEQLNSITFKFDMLDFSE
jgi:hypothetical protein